MAYTRVNWENLPSTNTPVNATNLNKMDAGIANAVEKTGDTMTGDLNMQGNSVKFGTNGNILFKEDGYGDKFRIISDFSGAGSSNKIKIQSTIGDAGTDPTNWKDLVVIHADTGDIDLIGNDTGWQEIPLISPATTATNWNVLLCRKIGKVVYIRGIVYWNQTPSWDTQFALLSAGFRPGNEEDFACRSVDTNSATIIAIGTGGIMTYLENTDSVPGTGCFISCSFIAEN